MSSATQCYVCKEYTPSCHDHHTIPQSAGGVDSIQLPVCANCHNSIHRELNRLLSRFRKKQELGGIKWHTPKHPDEITIAAKVIEIGLKGVINYELNAEKVYKVVVKLPLNVHTGLKKLKQDGGFTNLDSTIVECIKLGLHVRNIKI